MRRALVRFRLARGSTSRPLATVAGSFSARLSDSLVQLQREWNHLAHVQADLQDSMPACSAADLPSLHKRLHQSYTLLLKSVVLDPEAHVNDVLVVFDSICTRYPPMEDDLLHMISWARRFENPDHAIQILEMMLQSGWPLNAKACNQVLEVIARSGDLQRCSALLDRVCKIGFQPDPRTYAAMITACERAGDVATAERWFSALLDCERREGDVVVVGAMMSLYARHHRLQECMDLMNSMGRLFDVQRNVQIYTVAIDAHRRANCVGGCLDLFQQMLEEGIHPTVVTYNCLLSAVATTGDVQKSIQIYRDMIGRGLRPDIVTFQALLNAHRYSPAGKITSMTMTPEARELPLIARSLMIEARFRYGISPDLKMYTTLVHIFTLSGHTVDALMCFVDMMAAGFQPDLTMYSALMNALSDQGAFHQCCNLLATVKRNGITANVQLYTAVIASLRHHFHRLALHALAIANDMFAERVRADAKFYRVLLQVLARGRHIQTCVDVITAAVARETSFSPDDWSSIVSTVIVELQRSPDDQLRFAQAIPTLLPFPPEEYPISLQEALSSMPQPYDVVR
ncbi:Pentacotripeptide-repeat region of PRORP domain-containing protein [Plasmodiophora brassicae]